MGGKIMRSHCEDAKQACPFGELRASPERSEGKHSFRLHAAIGLLLVSHAVGEAQVKPSVRGEAVYAEARGRYDLFRVRLRGAGETATGQLLRPRGVAGPLPAVLLNNGR